MRDYAIAGIAVIAMLIYQARMIMRVVQLAEAAVAIDANNRRIHGKHF